MKCSDASTVVLEILALTRGRYILGAGGLEKRCKEFPARPAVRSCLPHAIGGPINGGGTAEGFFTTGHRRPCTGGTLRDERRRGTAADGAACNHPMRHLFGIDKNHTCGIFHFESPRYHICYQMPKKRVDSMSPC